MIDIDSIVRIESEFGLHANQVGRILRIEGAYAEVVTFDILGHETGSGRFLLGYLTELKDPRWAKAGMKRDAIFDRYSQRVGKRSEQVEAGIKRVAERYGVSPENAVRFYEELYEVYNMKQD